MMVSRKTVIEVLIALFVTGCVVFVAERSTEVSPSLALNQITPKKALLKDEHRHFKILQNCSNTASTTDSWVNSTTGQTQTVTTNSSACSSSPSALPVILSSESTITYPFQSGQFQMVLNMNCLTSSTTVQQLIAQSLGVDPGQITIVSTSCGSLIVTYTCGSLSSSADATSVCNSINTAACNPSTTLGQALNGLTCTQINSVNTGSHTALFGLFALCAIPILIVFALFLWYRTSQREADNQYMQDTATFSNVATAPQPLGPQPAYPAAPAAYTTTS